MTLTAHDTGTPQAPAAAARAGRRRGTGSRRTAAPPGARRGGRALLGATALVVLLAVVSTFVGVADVTPADLISILFTATPDLVSEFPALAARELGLGDVPLMCATEIAVPHALPRVLRLMAHVETPRERADISHVYLRGAVALRRDIAQ